MQPKPHTAAVEVVAAGAAEFKAQPMPEYPAPAEPVFEHKHTQPQPFEFVEKRPDPRVTREQLAAEAEAAMQAARSFKARPIPEEDPHPLPPVPPAKPPTEPQPFTLQSHAIGEQLRARHIQQVQEELAELKAQREFHATQPTSLGKRVFMPRKSNKPLTSVGNVNLRTDERVKQRAAFDKKIAEKQAELERLEEEARIARQKQEELEVQALRKQLVHKVEGECWRKKGKDGQALCKS